jgi:hypothetical protein
MRGRNASIYFICFFFFFVFFHSSLGPTTEIGQLHQLGLLLKLKGVIVHIISNHVPCIKYLCAIYLFDLLYVRRVSTRM